MRGRARRWRIVSALMATGALAAGTITAMSPPATAAAPPTTVTYAESAEAPPTYIFPFENLHFFTITNVNQFQLLMYRPLYWFGQGTTPNLDPPLSLADEPVYSNDSKTVTLTLKNYKWSNGEPVTSTDILFWMNMLHAEKINWAAYVPGGTSMPDNIRSITIDSPTQLTFQLTGSFNTYWYTYNQLSQITPLPLAWDKTSNSGTPGSGGCSSATFGTNDAACAAVYTYLSKQAGYDPDNPKAANNALASYATNPLWQVVDGPWHLQSFDTSGNVTMVPNSHYSGPVKPTIKKFIMVPFTSDSAEFNALVAGKVDVGFLPFQDITQGTANAHKAGPNNPRLSDYTLDPLYGWSINFFPYNFESTGNHGVAGKLFNQLYFRQAFQALIDQPLYIKKIYHGYGIPTYGPVPVYPSNSFASSEEKTNPYPYDPARAKALLSDHGWRVVPNGTSTCERPGNAPNECGAGIAAGAKLSLALQYVGGTQSIVNLMNAEKASWAQAGVQVALSSASFDTVTGNASPCPRGCSWQMENWGEGWLFAPDYYPTGEEIFSTGAGSNSGSYSNPINDALTDATNTQSVNLNEYENYLSEQLPVVYQPNQAAQLTEIHHGLAGVVPQNVLWEILPEQWRWK